MMEEIRQKQERNNNRAAYEILIMRSWKRQQIERIDPSVTCYEELQNSVDGLNFSGRSEGRLFTIVRESMMDALFRLIDAVKCQETKTVLEDLAVLTNEAVFIEQIDEIVWKALSATQSLVK